MSYNIPRDIIRQTSLDHRSKTFYKLVEDQTFQGGFIVFLHLQRNIQTNFIRPLIKVILHRNLLKINQMKRHHLLLPRFDSIFIKKIFANKDNPSNIWFCSPKLSKLFNHPLSDGCIIISTFHIIIRDKMGDSKVSSTI